MLTGILVRFESDKLVMAATDSYRLSVKETPLSTPGPDLEAIIPARALGELARIAAGAETLQLGVNENHVIFGSGAAWLTTRRIDGQFPNLRQLLPETLETIFDLPRKELLDIVRRAGVMAQRNAPLRLRFAEGELTVSAQSQDVGETRRVRPGGLHRGALRDRLQRGLPPRGSRVGRRRHRPAEAHQPAPARPDLAEGDGFWYLIMPIRLAG